eukprot:768541-Hanusia_phi.AAC.7
MEGALVHRAISKSQLPPPVHLASYEGSVVRVSAPPAAQNSPSMCNAPIHLPDVLVPVGPEEHTLPLLLIASVQPFTR